MSFKPVKNLTEMLANAGYKFCGVIPGRDFSMTVQRVDGILVLDGLVSQDYRLYICILRFIY